MTVAEIIRKIPDRNTRLIVANHFSTEFNRRSKAFDPNAWYLQTGGLPDPDSAA